MSESVVVDLKPRMMQRDSVCSSFGVESDAVTDWNFAVRGLANQDPNGNFYETACTVLVYCVSTGDAYNNSNV